MQCVFIRVGRTTNIVDLSRLLYFCYTFQSSTPLSVTLDPSLKKHNRSFSEECYVRSSTQGLCLLNLHCHHVAEVPDYDTIAFGTPAI